MLSLAPLSPQIPVSGLSSVRSANYISGQERKAIWLEDQKARPGQLPLATERKWGSYLFVSSTVYCVFEWFLFYPVIFGLLPIDEWLMNWQDTCIFSSLPFLTLPLLHRCLSVSLSLALLSLFHLLCSDFILFLPGISSILYFSPFQGFLFGSFNSRSLPANSPRSGPFWNSTLILSLSLTCDRRFFRSSLCHLTPPSKHCDYSEP